MRIGFDLDGVLLYNPARIARPLVTSAKRALFRKKEAKFFIPTTPAQQFIWRVFHYSSLFVDPGVDEVKKLVDQGKIEAYVISGRYGFLATDFEKWMRKINTNSHFLETLHNIKNQQPYLFKKGEIDKLKLDVFIEDNWDVVQKLQGGKTKIFWLYNILDRALEYKYKFPTLKKALNYIQKELL